MAVHLSRNRMSVLLGALGVLTLAGVTRTPVQASSMLPDRVVSMSNNRFVPAEIHVVVGETVVWRNNSQIAHTVTGPNFDSGLIQPGGSFTQSFASPGTIEYHCTPHQSMGMVGRIVVTAK
jgi:plastocyanin